MHSEMARNTWLLSYSSTSTAVALSFGGTVSTGTASLLLFSKPLRQHGTDAKKKLITVGLFLLILASIFASIASAEQVVNLSAVFSESACTDDVACPSATLARRRAVVSSTSAPLWTTTLGLAVLAYTPKSRVRTWQDERGLDSTVAGWGALSTALVILIVATHVDFRGVGSHIDIAFLVAIIGIASTAFVNAALGNALFVLAIGFNEVFTLFETTVANLLTHPTHATVFTVVLVLVLRVAIELLLGCWRLFDRFFVDLADDAVGLLSIVATSVSVLLFLCSAALESTYPGSLLEISGYGATRDVLNFVLNHYLPCLVCLPIYARSAAVANVARTWRLATWCIAPLVPLALWVVSLAVTRRVANHTIWFQEQSLQFAIVAVALVPWFAVALV